MLWNIKIKNIDTVKRPRPKFISIMTIFLLIYLMFNSLFPFFIRYE